MHELYSEKRDERSIEITAGALTAFRSRNIEKHIARVVAGAEVRSAHHVGPIDPTRLLARATAATDTAVAFGYDLPADNVVQVARDAHASASLEAATQAALDKLRAAAPGFKFSGRATRTKLHRAVSNGRGTDCSLDYTLNRLEVTYRRAGSQAIFDGLFAGESAGEMPFLGLVEAHLPLLEAFDRLVELPAERLPVLFAHPEQFLLAKLADSLRLDRYEQGTSLYAGRLGEQLFDPAFSLADESDLPQAGIVAPFDGEGVTRAVPRLPLIEAGRLTGLVADAKQAARYGVAPTGNGIRHFESGITLGFNGVSVGRGRRTWREIVADLPACVLVGLAIAGATSADGVFSSPLNLAFLVRYGEIVGRLPQITVRAPLTEVFGPRLIGISANGFEPTSRNACVVAEMQVLAHR